MQNDLLKKELWTQREVANYFRVVPGTVHNWCNKGLLKYFRAPGSSRIMFFRDDILRFRDENTVEKKGGDARREYRPIEEKPDISATKKQWRI